jgi:hypothetical protein
MTGPLERRRIQPLTGVSMLTLGPVVLLHPGWLV